MLFITIPGRSPLSRAQRAIRPGDPVLAVAAALSVASVLAGASLAPGLAGLEVALGAEPGALWVRLLVSTPALGVPFGAMLGAILARRLGDPRRLLMAALWGYAICGAAGALGLALAPMLALRFVQGVALGPVMLAALALLRHAPADEMPRRLAAQSMVMTAATLLILPVAAMASGLSWRLPFLMNLAPLLLLPAVASLPLAAFGAKAGAAPADTAPADPGRLLPGLLLAGAAMAVFFAVPTQMAGYLAGHGIAGALPAAGLIALSVLAAALAGAALRRASISPTAGPAPFPLVVAGFAAMSLGAFQLAFAAGVPPMALGVLLIGGGFGVLFPALNHWALSGMAGIAATRAGAAVTAAFHVGQFGAPILGSAALTPGSPNRVFLPYLICGLAALTLALVERRALRHAPAQAVPRLSTEAAPAPASAAAPAEDAMRPVVIAA